MVGLVQVCFSRLTLGLPLSLSYDPTHCTLLYNTHVTFNVVLGCSVPSSSDPRFPTM